MLTPHYEGVNPLADAVRDERLKRGWSIRRAVAESGNLITNTWWGKFEDRQQPLTDSIRLAVAAAYGWTQDWPEETFSRPTDASKDGGIQRFRLQAMQEIARQAQLLEEVRAAAKADVEGLQDAVLDLQHRLEVLEQRGRESG
jgi:hypothetical protein